VPQKLSELVLMSRIAHAYYLEGQSRVDIADSLSISRFRVARMLEAARRTGMVRIEISSPGIVDAELSVGLQNRFGLQHALVLDVPTDDVPALRAELGKVTGQLLSEVVEDGDVIGLSWARSLASMGSGIGRIPPCPVVQMTGAISRPDGSDVLELVRGVGREGGGPVHVFYAPMIVEDTATAQSLRRQPDIARAMELVEKVTVAVVGIGAWRAGQSTIYDAVSPADRACNVDAGVVAEVSGVFVGADGRPIESEVSRRAICPTGRQLEAVPNVLAVAYGVEKVDGVRSVLGGSVVNGLITHSSLAEALLAGA
jgi:DNA-binding transcriptional regulator LsrR (DeoR family)